MLALQPHQPHHLQPRLTRPGGHVRDQSALAHPWVPDHQQVTAPAAHLTELPLGTAACRTGLVSGCPPVHEVIQLPRLTTSSHQRH
ncbi:hypothetical protein GCM10010345_84550 [Streptomyces canarius]|uniref:Uncharacterized protein n=1 Tax=Streptomyces canarius TaxID=285453 RepID=A0ABQ3D9W6_9ACTN|nr:hypothetical protein GCM10010345_84550 [Streptomyces canarius]